MNKFEDQISKIDNTIQPRALETEDPKQFFSTALDQLEELYQILHSDYKFKQAIEHLVMLISTGQLPEDKKDFYTTQLQEITNYVQFMMFLKQEIRGY